MKETENKGDIHHLILYENPEVASLGSRWACIIRAQWHKRDDSSRSIVVVFSSTQTNFCSNCPWKETWSLDQTICFLRRLRISTSSHYRLILAGRTQFIISVLPGMFWSCGWQDSATLNSSEILISSKFLYFTLDIRYCFVWSLHTSLPSRKILQLGKFLWNVMDWALSLDF